jgi:hypothetical protein
MLEASEVSAKWDVWILNNFVFNFSVSFEEGVVG